MNEHWFQDPQFTLKFPRRAPLLECHFSGKPDHATTVHKEGAIWRKIEARDAPRPNIQRCEALQVLCLRCYECFRPRKEVIPKHDNSRRVFRAQFASANRLSRFLGLQVDIRRET